MHATLRLRSNAHSTLKSLIVAACCVAPMAHAADVAPLAMNDAAVAFHPTFPGLRKSELNLAFLGSTMAENPEDCDDTHLAEASTNSLLNLKATPLLALNTARPSIGSAKNAAVRQTANPAAPNRLPSVAAALATQTERAAPAQMWDIVLTDKTFNAALARWATQAGWQLVWELPVDYAVEARTTIPGTFVEAVTLVTNSMATAEIPLKAIFYEGNKVLRIVAKGNE